MFPQNRLEPIIVITVRDACGRGTWMNKPAIDRARVNRRWNRSVSKFGAMVNGPLFTDVLAVTFSGPTELAEMMMNAPFLRWHYGRSPVLRSH